MKKLICDECEKEIDILWILEAYNPDLEDYLNPSKELCKKCALKHLTKSKLKIKRLEGKQ